MSNESNRSETASLQGKVEGKQPAFFLAGLKILNMLLNSLDRLISVTRLTDEEEKNAGIDLNYQRYK